VTSDTSMTEETPSDTSFENTPERPDIRRFTDYRAYLHVMVAFLRAVRPGFSFRSFARKAGFASPNYLKLVADGMRNLAPESVDTFNRRIFADKRFMTSLIPLRDGMTLGIKIGV